MSGLKFEDPTVDVGDVEKYRLAFLMQFFVQHKKRFRFPRLRLQDLYQRVIKDSDATAFCDLIARILRFLSYGDPEISIDTVDQALDRFTMDKRTSYRISVQRHRNGKPVHQLGPMARAALLDNLIESVYDEQPDFNFTSGFNSSNPVTGSSNGGRLTNGGNMLDSGDPDGTTSLFNTSDMTNSDVADFTEPEDVNVLIKAGQDAQGCSYYYMDDLRLYRERPQSGISSQWDVAVGPTNAQWQAFILSLSRNEKEYDLYCFLKQDLFELVKDSLDSYELHSVNNELDSNFLRAKETNELAELRRRKGLISARLGGDGVDGSKSTLTAASSLAANGPKSASPAFSGGHGTCGIGSSGSAAPLTPSSARTPTSAPPATASGCAIPQTDPLDLLPTPKTDHSRGHTPLSRSSEPPSTMARSQSSSEIVVKVNNTDVNDHSVPRNDSDLCTVQPYGSQPESMSRSTIKNEQTEHLFRVSKHSENPPWPMTSEMDMCAQGIANNSCETVSTGSTWSSSDPSCGRSLVGAPQSFSAGPDSKPNNYTKMNSMEGDVCLSRNQFQSSPSQMSITPNAALVQQNQPIPTTPSATSVKQQVLVDQSPAKEHQFLNECANSRPVIGPPRPLPNDPVDNLSLADRQLMPGTKPSVGPATALVPPIVGIPDGSLTLTQEQWENRKSKIAQLEKIHSTLSKSKSASTPGAVAAAAGAVLQQQRPPHNFHTTANELSQPGPLTNHQSPGISAPNGFSSPSYPPLSRQGLPEGYPVNRMPSGPPPHEIAQREWDRMCIEYQREKGEPPGPRFHPASRLPPAPAYDANGCHLVPSDVIVSPSGTVMVHPGMEHPSCHAPQRHYPGNPDGPPVVMVPPNNSNITGGNAPYPAPGSGAMASASAQHFRSMSSMGHSCQDPSHGCMIPVGQKRPYYGPYGDSWTPPSGGCVMNSLSSNDSNMFPGSLPPAPPQRPNPLGPGSLGPSAPNSMSMASVQTTAANTSTGRTSTVSKGGGKKRKTATVSGRVSSVTTPSTLSNLQPQQQYSYCKQSGPNSTVSVTPNKPPYSMYPSDPSQAGFHPHRSVYVSSSPGQANFGPHSGYPGTDPYFLHYPEPNMGRSVGSSGIPLEGRRAITPKGGDSFPVGPGGYPMYNTPSGRMPTNCGMPFSSSGACGNSPMAHPYMHGSDMPGPNCEMPPGMRQPQSGSCTQHLTSASLASLARLSQLSGSEGPYVPSSGSASGGNSLGTIPGSGHYAGRSSQYHPDNVVVMGGPQPHMQPQTMRAPSGSVSMGMKSHDSELPPGAPHSGHTKFASQGYHGPSQQHPGSAQPAPSLQPQQQQQQVQSQQPPSIQVNNTFFNAQLNVQQMNYQHVSAPGSTAQMQIHFVQQQQQQQQHDQPTGVGPTGGGTVGNNTRPSRQTEPSSRMTVPNGPDFYPPQAPMGHPSSFGQESGTMHRLDHFPNAGASNADFQVVKPDAPTSTSSSLPPSGVTTAATSYGNTSVQITPRTPHTIQYLPTVTPSQGDSQPSCPQYPPPDSLQGPRSKYVRANSQYSSSEPTGFTHADLPMPEAMRQASYSSNAAYSNQSTAHGASNQQFQVQQYGSQTSMSSHPSNPNKGSSSQQVPVRGSWASTEGQCESNPVTGQPNVFYPSAVETQAMPPVPGGRLGIPPSHPSGRVHAPSYSTGYPNEAFDPTAMESTVSNESLGSASHQRSSHPQYGRPSAGSRHESPNVQPPPMQQQHSYRHQHQQQYSQSTQHQMFMSSSMGNLASDGSGANNQVQFMMSASASSSVQTTSTTIVTGDVSPMQQPTVNTSSEASTVPPSASANFSQDMKLNQYDPIPVGPTKRTMLLPSPNDEMKAGPPFIPGHAPQLSNRVPWQSNPNATATIPSNSINMDQHVDSVASYGAPYGTTTYSSAVNPNSVTGQSMGFTDNPGVIVRDTLGHQQSSAPCELPGTGLSNPPYPSSLVQ